MLKNSTLSKVVSNTLKLLRPPENINVHEWAAKYRYLSSEESSHPGNFDPDFVPYMKQPCEDLTDPKVETVAFMSGAQAAKTETAINYIGYLIHQRPCNIMIMLPDEKIATDWATTKLQLMFDNNECFKDLVYASKPGQPGSNERRKRFKGGFAYFASANVPNDLRMRSVKIGIADEIDGMTLSSKKDGDPVELLRNRTRTFKDKKLFFLSTPVDDETSRIKKLYESGNMNEYWIPCPHCGDFHKLEFENLIIPRTEKGIFKTEECYLVCPICGCTYDNAQKDKAVKLGKWIPQTNEPTDPKCRSYHINTLYSPVYSIYSIARDWSNAYKVPELKKTFWNTVLGKTWTETYDCPDYVLLKDRAEDYDPSTLIVPNGVLIIVAGVDIQKDRIALSIWGYGHGKESWLLYFDEIMGNPLEPEVWEKLDEILLTEFKHPSGAPLSIEATCIDSNYAASQHMVYEFCRLRNHRRVMPVRGDSNTWGVMVKRPTAADINVRGQIIKDGIHFWGLGTGSIKEYLYESMKLEVPGPGYMHTFKTARADFWKQVTAEKLKVEKDKRGADVKTWIKPSHARNEALDTYGYSLAALMICGSDRPGYFHRRADDMVAAGFNVNVPTISIVKETKKEVKTEEIEVKPEENSSFKPKTRIIQGSTLFSSVKRNVEQKLVYLDEHLDMPQKTKNFINNWK